MKSSGEAKLKNFCDGAPSRAFGNSTEFLTLESVESVLATHTVPPLYIEDYIDTELYVSHGRSSGTSAIVSTGGEIYGQSPSQYPLKYATPECSSPAELTTHMRAGEIIMNTALAGLARHVGKSDVVFRRSGNPDVYRNGRRVISEHSLGYRESYTSVNLFSELRDNKSSILEINPEAKFFADFLALRKIIDGAGMVADGHYSIAQKPGAINYRKFGEQTTHGNKQPFAQKEPSRLMVNSGEASKSDWQTTFVVSLTSLVLRLLEHSTYPGHLRLADPNRAVRDLSKDPHSLVRLESGVQMRGIDMLNEIVDVAIEETVLAGQDIPIYEEQAAYAFTQFRNDLDTVSLADNDVTALADRIDWAARFRDLQELGATSQTITSADTKQMNRDLRWSSIKNDPARQYYHEMGHAVLARNLQIPRVPQGTRAKPRLEITRRLQAANELSVVVWDTVMSTQRVKYELPNPLSTDIPTMRGFYK